MNILRSLCCHALSLLLRLYLVLTVGKRSPSPFLLQPSALAECSVAGPNFVLKFQSSVKKEVEGYL